MNNCIIVLITKIRIILNTTQAAGDDGLNFKSLDLKESIIHNQILEFRKLFEGFLILIHKQM